MYEEKEKWNRSLCASVKSYTVVLKCHEPVICGHNTFVTNMLKGHNYLKHFRWQKYKCYIYYKQISNSAWCQLQMGFTCSCWYKYQGNRKSEVTVQSFYVAALCITILWWSHNCSIFITIYNYTMVKVRLFCWWCCVCCIVLLTLCIFFNEPAMTTTKLPLVGWLKLF